jgi:branched-subunit amino acid aminotransferase/4-amino-4-deoxychorismate lyase
MIWVRGQVAPDEALRVSALDRTFEHGLGLFETFRTWNGHATLLRRHLERMQASARALELRLDPSQLPDEQDVAALLLAGATVTGAAGTSDLRCRITCSGGTAGDSSASSIVWMTARPLPPPLRQGGARITGSIQVATDDPLARHKTLNYWRKRIAHQQAVRGGSDEVLCTTHDRRICEGSCSNLFLVVGQRIWTPGLDDPLLPGVMRLLVLETAARIGIEAREGSLTFAHLATADEAFLTNSVRGLVPVGHLLGHELAAPGELTRRLWNEVLQWLESGGDAT